MSLHATAYLRLAAAGQPGLGLGLELREGSGHILLDQAPAEAAQVQFGRQVIIVGSCQALQTGAGAS